MKWLAIAAALALSACGVQAPVPLTTAGPQVIDMFAAMRAEAGRVGRAGLVPCTAEVDLALQAGADGSLGAGLPEGAKLGIGANQAAASTVKVTLKAPECGANLAPGEQPSMTTEEGYRP